MAVLGRALGGLWRTPLKWGVLYLALVPVFATIYSSLPARSFHDTNIKIEAPLASDAGGLLRALTAAVDARVEAASWHTSAGKLRLVRPSVKVDRIRHTDDGRLLIRLSGHYTSLAHREPVAFGTFQVWVQVFVESQLITQEPSHPPQVGYGVSLVNPDGGTAVRIAFTHPSLSSCPRLARRSRVGLRMAAS